MLKGMHALGALHTRRLPSRFGAILAGVLVEAPAPGGFVGRMPLPFLIFGASATGIRVPRPPPTLLESRRRVEAVPLPGALGRLSPKPTWVFAARRGGRNRFGLGGGFLQIHAMARGQTLRRSERRVPLAFERTFGRQLQQIMKPPPLRLVESVRNRESPRKTKRAF